MLTSCPLKSLSNKLMGVVRYFQAQIYRLYFTISTYLLVQLQFLTCINKHKPVSLTNKYGK